MHRLEQPASVISKLATIAVRLHSIHTDPEPELVPLGSPVSARGDRRAVASDDKAILIPLRGIRRFGRSSNSLKKPRFVADPTVVTQNPNVGGCGSSNRLFRPVVAFELLTPVVEVLCHKSFVRFLAVRIPTVPEEYVTNETVPQNYLVPVGTRSKVSFDHSAIKTDCFISVGVSLTYAAIGGRNRALIGQLDSRCQTAAWRRAPGHQIKHDDVISPEKARLLARVFDMLATQILNLANSKGIWNENRTDGDWIALCHFEISEGLEYGGTVNAQ